MTREIRFRGKRIDDGEWISGNLIEDSNGSCFINNKISGVAEYAGAALTSRINLYEVIPVTVGQSTGLKTSDGVDVYEGDIVVVRVHDNLCRQHMHKGIIRTIDGCVDVCFAHHVQFFDSVNDRKYAKCFTVNHALEVIGNIHEHPECE